VPAAQLEQLDAPEAVWNVPTTNTERKYKDGLIQIHSFIILRKGLDPQRKGYTIAPPMTAESYPQNTGYMRSPREMRTIPEISET